MIIKEIIQGAMRKLGVYSSGEQPTAAETADALDQVNRMLYNWSVQANGAHSITTEGFDLVVDQGEYTYGPGGDFDSIRPVKILSCWVRNADDVDSILPGTTHEDWASIEEKTESGSPKLFLYNPSFPLASIKLWPVLDAIDSDKVWFQTVKPLNQYSHSTDDLDLPPEYEEAIEWNLAAKIAPEYIGELTSVIAVMAQKTFNDVINLRADPQPRNGFRYRGSQNVFDQNTLTASQG